MYYNIIQIINLAVWGGLGIAAYLFGMDERALLYAAGAILLILLVVNEIFRQDFSLLKYLVCLATLTFFSVGLYVLFAFMPLTMTAHKMTVGLLSGFLAVYTVVYILFKAPHTLAAARGDAPGDRKGLSTALPKLLDTSALIDGRIVDICETGFIEGIFIVPRYVMAEMQLLSDSTDMLKRKKGRRGLDMIKTMQKSKKVLVQIEEKDYENIRGVDSKLVEHAKEVPAAIVTNDYNLNKIASIHGITVLNINDLADCIKTKLIHGEEARVTITKVGKDQNQGLAFLEDGTMIVVENGRKSVNKTVNVVITSVLQTPAGRTIFAKIK